MPLPPLLVLALTLSSVRPAHSARARFNLAPPYPTSSNDTLTPLPLAPRRASRRRRRRPPSSLARSSCTSLTPLPLSLLSRHPPCLASIASSPENRPRQPRLLCDAAESSRERGTELDEEGSLSSPERASFVGYGQLQSRVLALVCRPRHCSGRAREQSEPARPLTLHSLASHSSYRLSLAAPTAWICSHRLRLPSEPAEEQS